MKVRLTSVVITRRAVNLFDEKYESRLIARAGPVDVRIENVSTRESCKVSAEFRRGENLNHRRGKWCR